MKSNIFLAVFSAALCIMVVGYYFPTPLPYPDAEWYIKIAQGNIGDALQPFSGRILHPLSARLVSFLTGFDIHTSFYILDLPLLFGFVIMLALFFSGVSFINAPLAFIFAFSPFLLNFFTHFYLAELFYSLLLILFFYFLRKGNLAGSLIFLALSFFTRPIQAVVLGIVLVFVSFYKSKKKLALWFLIVFLLGTLASFQISALGRSNAHHLDNFRYYVLQPIYYFIRSVLGIDFVANTGVQYCAPKFWIPFPHWIPLGDIKSAGICGFNINWPLQTFFYPLVAFGFLPLILFFFLYKNWREIWKESPIWLLTALIYGLALLFVAALVPGWRPIGYAWPAFLLASLFVIDRQFRQWPEDAKKKLIKLFVFAQFSLLWLPAIVFNASSFRREALAFFIIFILYIIFIKAYLSIFKKYSLVYNK